MTTLKESTSTTSLTTLTEACHFCTESSTDPETGHVLISSTEFLTCSCKFKTHKECWLNYMQATPDEPKAKCPLCSATVASWKKAYLRHMSEDEKSERCNLRYLLGIGCLAAITMVALVAGVTVHSS